MEVLLSMLAVLASIFIGITTVYVFNRHTHMMSTKNRLEERIDTIDEEIEKLESDLDGLVSSYESIENTWRSVIQRNINKLAGKVDEKDFQDIQVTDDEGLLGAKSEDILNFVIRETDLDDNGYKEIRNVFMDYIYENESEIKNKITEGIDTDDPKNSDVSADDSHMKEPYLEVTNQKNMRRLDNIVSEYREDKKIASRKRKKLERLRDRKSDLEADKKSLQYPDLRGYTGFALLAVLFSVGIPSFTGYLYSVGFSLSVENLEFLTDNDILAVLILWVSGLIIVFYRLARLIRR